MLFSFSVDDGTSFANVKCYSVVVQKLLELSDTEWVNLEEAVKLQGDIFITSVLNLCIFYFFRTIDEYLLV